MTSTVRGNIIQVAPFLTAIEPVARGPSIWRAAPPARPRRMLRDLAAGNRFTDAELVINRQGRIAQAQIPRLITQALRPLCGPRVCCVARC